MLYIKIIQVNTSLSSLNWDLDDSLLPVTLKRVVKFGYTKDDDEAKKNRDSCYNTHAPCILHLKYIEGATEEDEKALHYIFRPYLFWTKEWFEFNNEIKEFIKSVNTLDELRSFISSHMKPKECDYIKNFSSRELRSCVEIILSEAYNDVPLVVSIAKSNQIYEDLIKNKDQLLCQFCFNQYEVDDIVTKLKMKEEQLNSLSYNLAPEEEIELNQFYLNFKGSFDIKMKMYCEFRDKHLDNFILTKSLNNQIRDYRFDQYYSAFGTLGCKAKSYKEIELEREINNSLMSGQLKEIILKSFLVGNSYLSNDIKEKLGEIYKDLGLTKTPKATDLKEWFILQKVNIPVSDRGLCRGYRIVSIKSSS